MTLVQRGGIDELLARFRGEVLLPHDAGYDEARQVWNAMIDRRPALIARCRSSEDVAHAVRFARKHNLVVSIRGGGHNIAGSAVCDAGLMIDLSLMKGVQVDPAARRAAVEPDAPWPTSMRLRRCTGLPRRWASIRPRVWRA